MIADLYTRPTGRKTQFNVTNITEADETWFAEQGVSLGFEDCGFFTVIYATHPELFFEDELDEVTYIVKKDETCEEALSSVRKILQSRLSNENKS